MSHPIIIDYQHVYSGHCESGTTAGLLNHYGLPISEPMAFGIGSGLYFCYLPFVKAQDAPLFAFRILPGKIFQNATHRLGIKVQMISKFRDPKEAMRILDDNLSKSIPTGIQVGTFHLNYFPAEYRLHYNFHNVVVFGKENGFYHISEPMRQIPQLLSREDLEKARFAKGMFGPKGRMYYVLHVDSLPDFRQAIRKSIRNTTFRMTGQRFPYIGVRGITTLASDIKKWEVRYSHEKATFYLIQFIRSIEEFGTGGAGYRYIYGAFLKEAGILLNHQYLIEKSLEMGEIATLWREFSYRSARFIKNREDSNDTFLTLSGLLDEIACREKRFFKGLAFEGSD